MVSLPEDSARADPSRRYAAGRGPIEGYSCRVTSLWVAPVREPPPRHAFDRRRQHPRGVASWSQPASKGVPVFTWTSGYRSFGRMPGSGIGLFGRISSVALLLPDKSKST